MKRIHLVSAAGHPNYGDELITLAWLRALARLQPRAEVWLDCPHPGRAAVLFAGAHPGLRVTDTLWTVARLAHAEAPDDAPDRARTLIANLGTPHVDLGILAARESDAVHLLGGGYITSTWPENVPVVAAAQALADSAPGMRTFATGLGLTPLSDTHRRELADTLGRFTFADVRDAASAEATGLRAGHDDAFLALGVRAIAVDQRPAPRSMILLQGDVHHPETMSALVPGIVAAAQREVGEHGEIGVIEANPGIDALILESVREHASGSVRFYPFAEVWREGVPVHPGQAWFTSRFHLHLVGAMLGARGVAVSLGSDYYGVKHGSLVDEGSGWTTVAGEWSDDLTATIDPEFPARARALGAERVALARTLYGRHPLAALTYR